MDLAKLMVHGVIGVPDGRDLFNQILTDGSLSALDALAQNVKGSFTFNPRNSSLPMPLQKSPKYFYCLNRLFLMRDVTALINYLNFGIRNFLMKFLTKL
jgi:hypothetical protein